MNKSSVFRGILWLFGLLTEISISQPHVHKQSFFQNMDKFLKVNKSESEGILMVCTVKT